MLLTLKKKQIVIAISMLCVCSVAHTETQSTEDLYIERGNIQVSRVVKTNPMGGTSVEYIKTRIDTKNEQSPSELTEASPQITEPAQPIPVISKGTASTQHEFVNKTDNVVPLDVSLMSGKNTESPMTANKHETDIPQQPILSRKNPSLMTKSDSNTAYERTLLEKIKARKKQLEQQKPDDSESLKLIPGEQKVNLPEQKVPKKKKQRISKRTRLAEDTVISRLEFTQASMLDVARALADISGLNFVATEKAAKKNVTVFLQNISVKDALEVITKNSGLWYRKDKRSNVFRIMTTSEYQRDLIVYREDTTKVFRLLHPNPIIIATAINDLYGNRVQLSFGEQDNTFMPAITGNGGGGRGGSLNGSARRSVNRGNRQNGNRLSGNRGSNINNTNQNIISNNLTSDQIQNLEGKLDGQGEVKVLSGDAVKSINNREQPIYITLNQEHDLMIVRTSDNDAIKDIEQLVKQLDLPVKQVLLEMKILSLDVGDAYRQSMDLDYIPSNEAVRGPATDQDRNPLFSEAPINTNRTTNVDDGNGNTYTETQSGVYTLGVRNILGLGNFALEGGTFVYQFLNDKIRARIQLLQQNNRINTLSSPILLTSNNKPSRVFVGTEQVVTTGFDAIAGAANGLAVSNPAIIPITEIRNIGNTLQVMPKINADKTVTLLIQQDSSTLIRGASTIPIPVGNTVQSFNVDSVRTSNINGTVQAKDGLTIAIGGLIDSTDSEEEQKVPILGDFPILGEFFKRKVQEKSKRELLLLITPHIIETPHDAEDLTRDAVEPISQQEW